MFLYEHVHTSTYQYIQVHTISFFVIDRQILVHTQALYKYIFYSFSQGWGRVQVPLAIVVYIDGSLVKHKIPVKPDGDLNLTGILWLTYILIIQRCNSTSKYIVVHTSTDWYVLVHTSIYINLMCASGLCRTPYLQSLPIPIALRRIQMMFHLRSVGCTSTALVYWYQYILSIHICEVVCMNWYVLVHTSMYNDILICTAIDSELHTQASYPISCFSIMMVWCIEGLRMYLHVQSWCHGIHHSEQVM